VAADDRPGLERATDTTPGEHDIAPAALFKVVGTVLGVWLGVKVWPVFVLLLLSLMLVATFNPLVRRLQARFPRSWAITTVTLGVVLLGAGLLALMIPPLVRQAQNLITHLPQYAQAMEVSAGRSGIAALVARMSRERAYARLNMSANGLEILLVEDDLDAREILAEILTANGYQVAGVANGREALDCLRRSPPPRLILLDLVMPVMNGWAFRDEQRRDAALAEIPLVVVSGAPNRVETLLMLEAAEYLTKPVDCTWLLEIVAQYCRPPGAAIH
jgi:CheY-like chemotaxis protein